MQTAYNFQSQGWRCQKGHLCFTSRPPLTAPPDLAPLAEASDFLPEAEQAPTRKGPPDLVGRSPNPLQMGRWLALRAQLPGQS